MEWWIIVISLLALAGNLTLLVCNWRLMMRYHRLNDLLRVICYNAWTMRHRPEMRSLYLDAMIERMRETER